MDGSGGRAVAAECSELTTSQDSAQCRGECARVRAVAVAVAKASAELAQVEAKLTPGLDATERRQFVSLLHRALASIGE